MGFVIEAWDNTSTHWDVSYGFTDKMEKIKQTTFAVSQSKQGSTTFTKSSQGDTSFTKMKEK